MKRIACLSIALVLAVLSSPASLNATEVTLNAVTFPERDTVRFDFTRQPSAPSAAVKAKVKIREGQAAVEIKFQKMKPAVLFGGDVTCYVVWAVTRDGSVENLGELYFAKADDEIEFSSGLKSFALMITAEPYSLVSKPSPLVMFISAPSKDKKAPTNPFQFGDFGPAPGAKMETIAHISWDSSTSPMLLQAKKAFELAERHGAKTYAPQILREGRIALGQASAYSTTQYRNREFIDFSRRAVARASEAIQVTLHKKEAEALEREIAQRRAEMEAMETRAREAERLALEAGTAKAEAETALANARVAIAEVERQKADIEHQKAEAERQVEFQKAEAERQQAEAARQAELQKTEAARQAELQSAEAARQAELQSAEAARLQAEADTRAQEAIQKAKDELAVLATEKAAAEAERIRVEQSMAEMEAGMAGLRQESAELTEMTETLRREREEMSNRLQGALSSVADTHESARGLIINLPDILFDVDKANLKHEAQLVMAKLAGILLIMPELNLRIEGHTDATGGEEHNQTLSEERAAAVLKFLDKEGISKTRMASVGYGEARPIADNDSEAGRRSNRRVEVIIGEGEIKEAE